MALMDMFSRPEFWNWASGVGGGLSRAGRGQGYDISQANNQLFTAMKTRKDQERLKGLMDQFNLSPQQRGLMGALPLQAQQRILAQQAFPQAGEQTDFTRMLGMLPEDQRAAAVRIRAGLDPRAGQEEFALDRKVDMLRQSGVDMDMAQGIASGRYATSRDPITGTAQIVDKATGQVVGRPQPAGAGAGPPVVPPAPPAPAVAPPPVPAGLYGKAGETTGAVSAAKDLSTSTLGQLPGAVGEFFSFPETVKDRQVLTAASGALVRALSVNSRYPVGEMQRIRDEVGLNPSVLESKTGAQAKMEGIHSYLTTLKKSELAAAQDPALPADRRQDALEKLQAIDSFLGIMGVPEDGAEIASPAMPEVGAVDEGYRYKGGDPSLQSSWEKVE